MLEIIHLKSEREQLRHQIAKLQKYGFYIEPMKRCKSLQILAAPSAPELPSSAPRHSKISNASRRLKITAVNPKHIESHISDFDHLFAVHKKSDYLKTLKRIDEIKKMGFVGDELVC